MSFPAFPVDQAIRENCFKPYWNLREKNTTKEWLDAFIVELSKQSIQNDIFVDLVGNRLGDLTAAEFKNLFEKLLTPNLHLLHLRFGYDISFSNFIEGREMLTPEDGNTLSDRAAFIAPWLSYLVKRIDQVQEASNVEFRKSINGYIATEAGFLEKYVVKAVANAMKDAVILKYSYNFENEVGQLDGLVAGTWNSEEVIVFVEAKHNMDNAWKKAKKQLRSALSYWKKLIDIDLQEEPDYAVDYDELRTKEYGNRKPMYAFGGAILSPKIISKLDDQCVPCFFITPNPDGRFVVETK